MSQLDLSFCVEAIRQMNGTYRITISRFPTRPPVAPVFAIRASASCWVSHVMLRSMFNMLAYPKKCSMGDGWGWCGVVRTSFRLYSRVAARRTAGWPHTASRRTFHRRTVRAGRSRTPDRHRCKASSRIRSGTSGSALARLGRSLT